MFTQSSRIKTLRTLLITLGVLSGCSAVPQSQPDMNANMPANSENVSSQAATTNETGVKFLPNTGDDHQEDTLGQEAEPTECPHGLEGHSCADVFGAVHTDKEWVAECWERGTQMCMKWIGDYSDGVAGQPCGWPDHDVAPEQMIWVASSDLEPLGESIEWQAIYRSGIAFDETIVCMPQAHLERLQNEESTNELVRPSGELGGAILPPVVVFPELGWRPGGTYQGFTAFNDDVDYFFIGGNVYCDMFAQDWDLSGLPMYEDMSRWDVVMNTIGINADGTITAVAWDDNAHINRDEGHGPLPPETIVASDGVACLVNDASVACWSTTEDHGFRIIPDGVEHW